MKSTQKIKSNRKTFYKLIDSFEEKDFYAVKNFAEFIKTKNGKKTLKDVLSKVGVDAQPLSELVLKRIEESKEEIKNKKYKPLNEVMKNYGL